MRVQGWSLARRGRRQDIRCTHGRRRQVGWHIRETRMRRGRRRRGGRRYGDASDGCCWDVEVDECWIREFALGVFRPLFLLLLLLAFGVLLVIVTPHLCVQYDLWSRRRRVFLEKPTLHIRPPISSAKRLFLRIRRGGWVRHSLRSRRRVGQHSLQQVSFAEPPVSIASASLRQRSRSLSASA